MTYRRSPGWGQGLAVALLAAGAAACVAALATKDVEPPWADALRNERPHSCGDPGCDVCGAQREWIRMNPGRYPGDLMDAAQEGREASLPIPFTGPPSPY